MKGFYSRRGGIYPAFPSRALPAFVTFLGGVHVKYRTYKLSMREAGCWVMHPCQAPLFGFSVPRLYFVFFSRWLFPCKGVWGVRLPQQEDSGF